MDREVESSATGSRLSLRGVERTVTTSTGVSVKVAHSMLVRGDTTKFLRFLPTAVRHTFNMYPRMRALQLRTPRFMAEVQAPITMDTVAHLLQVRILTPADYGDGSPTSWQAFVENECSIGFDRHCQLPFYLCVWVATRKRTARLMLFSDQYMSDIFSGIVVLNGILEHVATLARQGSYKHQLPTIKECPLRPSLYHMWLDKRTWAKPLLKGTNAIFGRRILRGHARNFTPLLAARNDQADFAVPPRVNDTKALFADGEPKAMREALHQCRTEGVTLNGTVVVLAVLAFYRVRGGKEERGRFNPFRIATKVDCNMRHHVRHPIEERNVGMYTATTDLDWLYSEGVDVLNTRFWDLASRACREIDATLKNTLTLALPTIAADQTLNAQMSPSFLKNVRIAHSVTSDVGIAELCVYPFEKTHSMSESFEPERSRDSLANEKSRHVTDSKSNGTRLARLATMSSTRPKELSVESLHVFKALPHLAPSVTMLLSSVNAFGYSMAHKVDTEVAIKLFTVFVLLCESVGSIGGDDTLADVLARLDK